MDDLISRKQAIDMCRKPRMRNADCSDFEMEIMMLPSAQPEIVRCKDCKHYQYADNRAFGFPVRRCEWTGFEDVDEDDFCSRAERREVTE